MSFLAPLFLAGLLAIALPVWLHRLQTESSERKPFSSAMLLETSEQRIHVRKQLKYLALLALRILALVLVAMAFAGPRWTSPEALPGAGRHPYRARRYIGINGTNRRIRAGAVTRARRYRLGARRRFVAGARRRR